MNIIGKLRNKNSKIVHIGEEPKNRPQKTLVACALLDLRTKSLPSGQARLCMFDKMGKVRKKCLTKGEFCDKIVNCIIIASIMGWFVINAIPELAVRRRLCILTKARVAAICRLPHGTAQEDHGICRARPALRGSRSSPAATVFRSLCPLRRCMEGGERPALSRRHPLPPCPHLPIKKEWSDSST